MSDNSRIRSSSTSMPFVDTNSGLSSPTQATNGWERPVLDKKSHSTGYYFPEFPKKPSCDCVCERILSRAQAIAGRVREDVIETVADTADDALKLGDSVLQYTEDHPWITAIFISPLLLIPSVIDDIVS